MKNSVAELLNSFEHLPDDAKREVASEIMRRSANLDLPPLSDNSLVEAAESVFLALDKEESKHE